LGMELSLGLYPRGWDLLHILDIPVLIPDIPAGKTVLSEGENSFKHRHRAA